MRSRRHERQRWGHEEVEHLLGVVRDFVSQINYEAAKKRAKGGQTVFSQATARALFEKKKRRSR